LALVTGASGGIGEEFARRLAADGYDLALVARSHSRLEEIADSLRQAHGARVDVLAIDLSHPSGPARVLEQLGQHQSRLDVLINNAGYGLAGEFAVAPELEILGQIQLNVAALTQVSRLVLPGMLLRRRGRILNVGSTAAFQPGPRMAVYFATKAFVLSFSEAIAYEVRGSGVSVTCLCPGPVATGFMSRAQLESSRLFRRGAMPVEQCVDAGYRALLRGQTLCIPGMSNKLLVWSERFAPRWVVTRIAARMVERE
jgi:short-subunit dehydrogenase